MYGRVYLIGAGPGDPELITVKGLRILKNADVVVYDRLISKELLDNCKKDVELIYVGKNIGDSRYQDEINEILVKKAMEGKIVVRLKGGDPYVFGRGEEECSFVINSGIDCEVIPGITSAIAVPEYAGIPVTSRWFSSGFCVITGTKAGGEVIDKGYIPKKGTLVILMGINKVDRLKQVLLEVRDPDSPVAIIQDGTLDTQKVYISTISNLEKIVRENNVKSPAIIVVGEVIKLRNKLWQLS
ncbi:uroporphyrinogen-III C-methyltransferase [Acidianus brierleyi]|uniref:uroporphyrinogen-III C-methyltransferase n=1 Tax=Acidianus brierleyi TaxID=41673 RepID=A0A2U9IBJ8_9CREN|nr:uroporphyrinogen-III C-methyltransferase [Acidianus brierleyi]AWR93373.1 uroporphyrinogen-III C-methyltransferase [Acidianus brierleyi]